MEHDQEAPAVQPSGIDRDDFQGDVAGLAVAPQPDVLAADRLPLIPGLGERAPQLEEQPFPGQFQQVRGGLARRRFEERARAAAILEDLQVLVHEHGRGREPPEEDAIGLALEIERLWSGRAARLRGGDEAGAEVLGREDDGGPPRHRPLQVDLVRAVHEVEEIAVLSHGFRRAEHEEPRRLERVMEDREDALLERRRQVDQHVPAGDQVEVRERRVGGEVLPREDAHVPDVLVDPVEMVLLPEEPPQPLGADLALDALGVDPRPGLVQGGRVADVGGEDLDRQPQRAVVQVLEQGHGQRVRLLAGRAPRHPDPDRGERRPVFDQHREDLALERLEHLRVPEEAGHVDEEVVIQRLDLGPVALQPADVLVEGRLRVERHAAHDPPAHGRVPVLREIDAGDGPDDSEDPAVPVLRGVDLGLDLGRRGLAGGEVGMRADLGEPLRDVRRAQDEVHATAVDRADRHAGMPRGLLILGERDAAAGLDLAQAERAVGAGAGQDDSDGLRELILAQGTEEVVDREVVAAALAARRHVKQPPGQRQVGIRRNDVDMVRKDGHPLRRLHDGHARRPREQVAQPALVPGIEMLHEQECHPGVGREVREELGERFESARGRADADDGKTVAGGLRLRFLGLEGHFGPGSAVLGVGHEKEESRKTRSGHWNRSRSRPVAIRGRRNPGPPPGVRHGRAARPAGGSSCRTRTDGDRPPRPRAP